MTIINMLIVKDVIEDSKLKTNSGEKKFVNDCD